MNSLQQLQESVGKRFDEEFLEDGPLKDAKYLNGYIDTTSGRIKSFLTSIVAEAWEAGQHDAIQTMMEEAGRTGYPSPTMESCIKVAQVDTGYKEGKVERK